MAETTASPTAPDPDPAFIATAEALAAGVTLGDLRGLDDRHYEAFYAAGFNQYNGGRYDQAEKVFQFLVAHNPYDRRFPMALGAVKQVREQYADAIGYYGLACAMDLMDPVPVFHIAECLAALGRSADALEALGFVVRNATQPAHQSYKDRALALAELVREAGARA